MAIVVSGSVKGLAVELYAAHVGIFGLSDYSVLGHLMTDLLSVYLHLQTHFHHTLLKRILKTKCFYMHQCLRFVLEAHLFLSDICTF